MIEAIKKNEIDKDDYRYKWLMSTRNQVITTLRKAAEDSNAQNPHDCISVQDFSDAVEAVLLVIRANS